jgi:hypothetical protein
MTRTMNRRNGGFIQVSGSGVESAKLSCDSSTRIAECIAVIISAALFIPARLLHANCGKLTKNNTNIGLQQCDLLNSARSNTFSIVFIFHGRTNSSTGTARRGTAAQCEYSSRNRRGARLAARQKGRTDRASANSSTIAARASKLCWKSAKPNCHRQRAMRL